MEIRIKNNKMKFTKITFKFNPKRALFSTIMILLICTKIAAQRIGINNINPEVTLDINGALRVGNETNNSSPAGTIRFNPETGDFEGFDGNEWISFRQTTSWPNNGDWGSLHNYFPHTPSDAIQGDEYGYSVDIYNNYAVVGSPGWSNYRGRVLVLKKVGFNWVVKDTITSPNFIAERFGHSVAIWADYLVVGAPNHFYNYGGSEYSFGAIYIYKKTGENWEFLKSIVNNVITSTNLGESVDIRNFEIVAGASKNDPIPYPNPSTNSGHVLLYDIIADATSIINPPTYAASGMTQFGKSVSLYNQWLAVGAPCSNCPAISEDSVFIYRRPLGSSFSYDHTLNDILSGVKFGYSLEITDQLLTIGSPNFETSPGYKQGRVNIYSYNPILSKWMPSYINTGAQNAQNFGYSVSGYYPYCLGVANYSDVYEDPMKVIYKNDMHLSPYVHITDPIATIGNNFVNDTAIYGEYFIIGYPYGIAPNGTAGGRVLIGRVR
jgi:hypothetical protein